MNLFSEKPTKLKSLYETNYMGFWIKVFPNRVEFKDGAGSKNIPISQIASIQLGMIGLMQVVVETTGGEKYKIPSHKKKEVKEAIYHAQEVLVARQSNNSSTADELSKLAQLKDQGILSEKEFEV